MTNELTIQDAFPVPVQEHHMGIIQVFAEILNSLDITISQTDVQGQLSDTGIFAQIHQRLLLPASYTILAVFHVMTQRAWNIWVESPDLPAVAEYGSTPSVSLTYTRTYRDDGTAYNQLVEITSGEWKRDYRTQNLTAEWKPVHD